MKSFHLKEKCSCGAPVDLFFTGAIPDTVQYFCPVCKEYTGFNVYIMLTNLKIKNLDRSAGPLDKFLTKKKEVIT